MGNLSTGIGGQSYYEYARKGQIFSALALVTAPVAYSTAAGTGGPLLWNNTGKAAGGTNRVMAVLLGLGVGITTASGAGTSLGITGNTGQTAAPTSTTAIDAIANTYVGQGSAGCNLYRVGTVTNAGNFFQPVVALGTGALTVDNLDVSWFDLGGMFIVPPGGWIAVAAGAVATSAVLQIGLMWAEIPY